MDSYLKKYAIIGILWGVISFIYFMSTEDFSSNSLFWILQTIISFPTMLSWLSMGFIDYTFGAEIGLVLIPFFFYFFPVVIGVLISLLIGYIICGFKNLKQKYGRLHFFAKS